MKKAFTIIELVVAIALMVMVVFFSGVIFKVSIDAHRVTAANAEIMQKLRAITDQLNTDFKGVCKNLPILVWRNRIVFFANGDFQSVGQYQDTKAGYKKTVAGNVANIFYGPLVPLAGKPEDRILVRGQVILTSNDNFQDPNMQADDMDEYYKMSLSEWILAVKDKSIFPTKLKWAGHDLPLDIDSERDLVRYVAKGVDEFAISFERQPEPPVQGRFVWWDNITDPNWVDPVHARRFHNNRRGTRALKFTFRLYDSKGIIENGKKFSHIVYIGD